MDDRGEERDDREGGRGHSRSRFRDEHDGDPEVGDPAGQDTGTPCPGNGGGREGRHRAFHPVDDRHVDFQPRTRGRAPAHTAVADRVPVPAGTDWTAEELAEVRGDLQREITERRADYDRAMAELTRLQQASGDGAGDDQADAGSKTFEREQELSIANNRRDLLVQMERAMERLDKGTYGRCESCHEPIMKARLQAFPSATLCVTCKQREERR